MENPFSSPQTVAAADAGDFASLPPERERLAKLGEVFVAWERLRIWYNAVLAVVALGSLLVFFPHLLLDMGALEDMVLAAIGANVCFLAGPLLEGYVTWWFGPVPWLRKTVFIIGTLGAIFLTYAVISICSRWSISGPSLHRTSILHQQSTPPTAPVATACPVRM